MTNKEIKHYKQIITTLEKYGKLFKDLPTTTKINMNQGEIPTCKTPGCVGGYIALFNGEKEERGVWYYKKGADILANEMGFEYKLNLQFFFRDNLYIWGNRSGWYLFCNDSAYNEGGKEYPNKTLTPLAIAKKFYGVAKRMKEELKRLEK